MVRAKNPAPVNMRIQHLLLQKQRKDAMFLPNLQRFERTINSLDKLISVTKDNQISVKAQQKRTQVIAFLDRLYTLRKLKPAKVVNICKSLFREWTSHNKRLLQIVVPNADCAFFIYPSHSDIEWTICNDLGVSVGKIYNDDVLVQRASEGVIEELYKFAKEH